MGGCRAVCYVTKVRKSPTDGAVYHSFGLIDGAVVKKSPPMLTELAVVVEADQSVPISPSDD